MQKLSVCLAAVVAMVGLNASVCSAQPPGGFEGGPARMMRMLPLMAAIDADANGEISADEIKNAAAALTKLDKNSDGKLTAEELRPDFAAFGGQPGAPGGFGGRGGDRGAAGGATGGGRGGDGGPGAGGQGGAGRPGGFGGAPNPTGFIDRMFEFDADKDGKLTREELGKMAEQFGRGFGGGRGGEGGRPQRPQRPE